MKRSTFGRPADFRRRAAVSVDVRAMVEGYLREQARAGRLNQLVRSRDALTAHYRAQGNDTAVYCLASAPDFSLVPTPGGGARLVLRRSGDVVSWTHSELLKETMDPATEVESRAIQLAGGPQRYRALSDEERDALTAQAADEVIRRQRDG